MHLLHPKLDPKLDPKLVPKSVPASHFATQSVDSRLLPCKALSNPKNLYKIFGNTSHDALQRVLDGLGKPELLAQHNHVLGLNNINIDIPEKRVQVIMGLSGSGKSTLIRHLNRLIDPTAGQVLVDGEDVLQMDDKQLRVLRQKKMSMVFQKFALMPHRTVADNAAYGLRLQGVRPSEAKERAQKWIDRVGLTGFEKSYPSQLSGGLQPRVGLARALAPGAGGSHPGRPGQPGEGEAGQTGESSPAAPPS